jgi:hypothetical protein
MFSNGPVNPLTVYLWLIRMEPFTSLHIHMQSGRFDHAARLFHSIPRAFELCTTKLNDYRELIPEFFCCPEFLLNKDQFELGNCGDEKVNDVILPNWASSTYEFIYLNRKALESEYVSSHLQQWIDLIWGERQRGDKAEFANNVFLPDIYDNVWSGKNQCDPEIRAAIEAITSQVGQIPPQLFISSHPSRLPHPSYTPLILYPLLISSKLNGLIYATVKPFGMWNFRISAIDSIGNSIILGFDPTTIIKMNKIRQNRKILNVDLPEIAITRGLKTLPQIHSLEKGKTCLCRTINSDQFILVGKDRTEWTKVNIANGCCNKFPRQRNEIVDIKIDGEWIALANKDSEILVFNERISQSPVFTIPTFTSSISCIGINQGFHIIVFGTRDGSFVFCSLNSGSVTRTVSLEGCRPLEILITPFWGFVLVYVTKISDGKLEHFIKLYSVNGDFIRVVKIENQITGWTAFTSSDGFDQVVMIDGNGNCFCFEAFFIDLKLKFATAPLKIVFLSVLVQELAILIIGEDGTIVLSPIA